MKNIALIPARGGSKRLPDKNILNLDGKPLIWYTIKVCLESLGFDRVIVSTDSEKIAEIAVGYGAEVPFLRPDEFADDGTGDREVMLHAINLLQQTEGYRCDNLFYMRPTSPFKTVGMVHDISNMLSDQSFDSIRSVTKVSGVNHPYWMFSPKNEQLIPFVDGVDIETYYQSQLLPECYRLNGVIDAIRIDTLFENTNNYGLDIGYLEIEELRAMDIDTMIDFKFCQFLLEQYPQLKII